MDSADAQKSPSFLLKQVGVNVALAFSQLVSAAHAQDRLAYEKVQTARLAAQMPVIPENLLQMAKIPQPDQTKALQDEELIRFGADNFSGFVDIKEFEQAKKERATYALSGFGAFMALNYAVSTKPATPEAAKRIDSLKARFNEMTNSCVLRTNCYSFAVGDTCSNKLFVGANPGEQASGKIMHTDDAVAGLKGALQDGLSYVGNDPAAVSIPAGKRLIAYYFRDGEENKDYHFTRFDRLPDGRMLVGSKLGTELGVEWKVSDNIYDEMRRSFSAGQDAGYTFRGFFLAPEQGLDVGVDAHLKQTGVLNTTADPAASTPEDARQNDAAIVRQLLGNPRNPRAY